MAAHPVKPKKRAPPKPRKDEVAVVEPAQALFFSFRYSSTEVSVVDGRTRIKSRRARFEDGKLDSEAFEGELGHSAYDRIVDQAQRHFFGFLSLFPPFRD
jgi:hypothetical protein